MLVGALRMAVCVTVWKNPSPLKSGYVCSEYVCVHYFRAELVGRTVLASGGLDSQVLFRG